MHAKPHHHLICPAFTSGLLRLALIAAGSLLIARAAIALPQDAAEQVQKLQGGSEKVEAVSPGSWTVVEQIENPDGHRQPATAPKQVAMSGGLRTKEGVLLEEASGGRVLLGEEQSPNNLKASKQFKSFQEYLDANSYAPLPKPPEGFAIREVARMPAQPVRITSDGSGKWIYVLATEGDVYQIELPNGPPKRIIEHGSYSAAKYEQCIGMTLDRERRIYIVENAFDFSAQPQMNHVTIYRSTSSKDNVPAGLKPWFAVDIPFAIDVFQHGVSHIAQGPDGMMYVSSGSRTDHGEKGNDPRRSNEGETPVTSAIWRLDPKSEHPKLEIFAKGIRNAFGFCWDNRARLFATENGPNADAPEELNLIEKGKHYGFPYKFADWDHKAYPDQPDAPAGLNIELPAATFDPHSSPSGIVFLGDDFPQAYRGTLLVARFGNLIGPRDVGFDVMQVRLSDNADGRVRGQVVPFMGGVARPTDLHLSGKGKIYLCEIWRQVKNNGGERPGRILELSVKSP